jgi:hypothetical protein
VTAERPKEPFPVIYSNFARITHGPLEVLIDFKRSTPEQPNAEQADPLVRIVLNPVIAKSFLHALQDNIAKYEANLGPIPDFENQPPSVH